jgi:hypothetical protein
MGTNINILRRPPPLDTSVSGPLVSVSELLLLNKQILETRTSAGSRSIRGVDLTERLISCRAGGVNWCNGPDHRSRSHLGWARVAGRLTILCHSLRVVAARIPRMLRRTQLLRSLSHLTQRLCLRVSRWWTRCLLGDWPRDSPTRSWRWAWRRWWTVAIDRWSPRICE